MKSDVWLQMTQKNDRKTVKIRKWTKIDEALNGKSKYRNIIIKQNRILGQNMKWNKDIPLDKN